MNYPNYTVYWLYKISSTLNVTEKISSMSHSLSSPILEMDLYTKTGPSSVGLS